MVAIFGVGYMIKKSDESIENNDDKMVCETDYQKVVENICNNDDIESFNNHVIEMIKKTIKDNR